MEGPTPVSALIHAATMVTAGVYLVSRCHVLYEAVPGVMLLVATIGAVTAFFAATIAMVNNDLKRILAYSTISQIGYMFLGAGVGAFSAGLFHLMTHAFFKALLFLGAGSVMHAMDGETDLRQLGGLGRKMPITKWTFLAGALAISGIFPFSGFFSKDDILWGAYSSNHGGIWLYALGLLTAVMTAFYTFRLVFMTFYARSANQSAVDHAHESPPSMTIPLIVLGLLAAVGGFVGLPASLRFIGIPNVIEEFLAPALKPAAITGHGGGELGPHALALQSILMVATMVLALAAISLAYLLYIKRPGTAGALARRFPALYGLIYNKYYVDEIYDVIFVRPGKTLALGLYNWIDAKGIDGAVNGAVGAVGSASRKLRLVETGYVRNYALAMLVGAVLLVAYLTVR
jgi:NADH-quinone oxidoreductase subunit L